MQKRFLLISILIGMIAFLVLDNNVCFSKDKFKKDKCESIFILLNPKLVSSVGIEKKIKKNLPDATVRNIKDTYLVKVKVDDFNVKKFDIIMNDVFFELSDEAVGGDVSIDELKNIQQKSAFCRIDPEINISSVARDTAVDDLYQARISIVFNNEDKKIIESIKYLFLNKSIIYKFLWDNAAFLNIPFLDKEVAYNAYLKTVENSFEFIEKNSNSFSVQVASLDKRFVEKAVIFLRKEAENLVEDLKTGHVLMNKKLWEKDFETIFKKIPAWENKHEIVVEEIRGVLKKKLEETQISCSFTNISLDDFMEFIMQQSQISVHIKYKINFSGDELDISTPGQLALLYGNLEFMASHIFSVKAQNVNLGVVFGKVFNQLGYKYEIGMSEGREVLFVEPIL